jgi:hypothetical protein
MRFLAIFLIIFFCLTSLAEEPDSSESTKDSEEVIDTGEGENNEEDSSNTSLPSPTSSVLDADEASFEEYDKAEIIALNKITAKSVTLIIKKNESKYFGNIQIKAAKCVKNKDPYNPESKVLIKITENKLDEDPFLLFNGWMFSSSISLSTFEHPVYEVFAKNCIK